MLTRSLLAVLIVLAGSSVARADFTVHAPENRPAEAVLREWAQDAAVNVPMPRQSFRVIEDVTACGEGTGACVAGTRGGQVMFYSALPVVAEPGYPDELQVRILFLHELGHVLDMQTRDKWYRAVFLRWLLPTDYVWRRMSVTGDPSADELFADAYSRCALDPMVESGVDLGYGRSLGGRYRRVCRLIRSIRP